MRHNYFQYMKKWIIAAGVLFILTAGSIYIFIPSKIVISKIIIGKITINGENRFLAKEEKWEKWWRESDGKKHIPGSPFSYHGATYRLTSYLNNAVGIEIFDQGQKMNSVLHLFSLNTDSTGTEWECEFPAGMNPIGRVKNYRKAVAIKENITGVMKNLISFLEDYRNIYGIEIRKTTNYDTLLISTRFKSVSYPSTEEIYGQLSKMEENIKAQKATVTGFPMLHIEKKAEDSYETQLAIGTSIWMKDNGPYFSRRMVAGNFMVSDVTGGLYTINQAYEQLDKYMDDYAKTRMAIPFQLLLTDRIKEPDTAKWKTRLYMPVME